MVTVASPTTLPTPSNGRVSAYLPDHAGQGPTAVIHLQGWSTIFRFAVNLLEQQVDIARAGKAVLVPLREHMTPARFDPMARQMLGDNRYSRLRDQFERSWDCQGCERDIRVGWRYYPTDDAGSICAACCKGHPEYRNQLVKRPPPVAAIVTVTSTKALI